MIKASGKTGQNVPMLYLGLSSDNIIELGKGNPIFIRSHEMVAMGFQPMVVIIDLGYTEEGLREKLRHHGITLNTIE